MKQLKYILLAFICGAMISCSGGGGSSGSTQGSSTSSGTSTGSTTTTGTSTTVVTNTKTAQVTALSINSTSPQILSDGSTTATLIVTSIDSSNAAILGAEVRVSADTGLLSSSTSLTDVNGQAKFVFSSGSIDRSTRIATIIAVSNGATAQTQIKITGGTITLDSGGVSTALVGGTNVVVFATVRDVSGVTVPTGTTVTFDSTNNTILSVTPKIAFTNSAGIATSSVAALAAGKDDISASAKGVIAVLPLTGSASGSGFYVSAPSNSKVITTGTTETITVIAPNATAVTFVTPLGLFGNGQNNQNVAVIGGVASATYSSSSAGEANISVYDPAAPTVRSATVLIKVSPPVSSANKLLITANKSNVPVSNATTQNGIQIKARAIFNTNGTDVGVFNVPVLFSISGGPGAGESISQAIAFTDASGNASTTFVAGTQATTQNGVRVNAQILNSAVTTNLLPSNNDLIITIGGQALSVVFTRGSVILPSADNTYYDLPMSAQVTDANGNAVKDELVSLSLKPYAFSTGTNACTPVVTGTYCTEDLNSNGSTDFGEDGVRRALPNDLSSLVCGATAIGSTDLALTPPNASAGSVPDTIRTNTSGVAGFNLTYLKGNATWIVVKLTATVGSSGTESSYSSIFRLVPSADDATKVPCPLPASPFTF